MSVLDRIQMVPRKAVQTASSRKIGSRIALVFGTGDIASAIGRALFISGWGVVMLRGPGIPVLRRGMAFDNALEDGRAELEGVTAQVASTPDALPDLLSRRQSVILAACRT